MLTFDNINDMLTDLIISNELYYFVRNSNALMMRFLKSILKSFY